MKLLKTLARLLLGAALTFAGTAHLSFARAEFQAQVPTWLPLDADFVVLASGVVEIAIGVWLLTGYKKNIAGLAAAALHAGITPVMSIPAFLKNPFSIATP